MTVSAPPSDSPTEPDDPHIAARRRWMAVLARGSAAELADHWGRLGEGLSHDRLRAPESGLVMVRGRAGGSGSPFNLGEMTVTRCSVRLAGGAGGPARVGHATVAGRDRRHAELAALFDALLQDPARHDAVERTVIAPLEAAQAAAAEARSRKAAATKVDFFTMVRGEDT